jgi:creatine kinase
LHQGVDNSVGFSFTGIAAGDEESYEVFKELFDKIIYEKHKYKLEEKHRTDLDVEKLENGTFDEKYVLSIRVRTVRNVRGFCLPPFCGRGERRDIESVLVKSLYNLNDRFSGTYFSLKELSIEEEANLLIVT